VRAGLRWAAGLLVPLACACAAPNPQSTTRIVSLAPSLTEIAYAVGCGPKLVADTTFDDYPASARQLPHVADLVTVDLERVTALAPSVVLALHDQEREATPIEHQLHIRVEYLPNRDLSDLFADIDQVGGACGNEVEARQLNATLHQKLARLERTAAAYHSRPKVFFLLGLPGFTAGAHSFIDDLITLAAGINVAASIHQPYPDVSAEWLLQSDPDVIVVAREAQFGSDVTAREPWRSLRAVQSGRIVRPPSDDLIERNGPRIVDGLSWLIHAIHTP
jgi:ABC-type Fe3+-hydroxamate transport system substrate-binding protein